MEQLIDLDAAAAAIARRIPSWRSRGLTGGPMTWADDQTTVRDTTDRSRVRGDYSVGVTAERGDEQGAVVLYAGGWCDLEYWSGDTNSEPVVEAPGWNDWLDLEAFERVLDRFESLFADHG